MLLFRVVAFCAQNGRRRVAERMTLYSPMNVGVRAAIESDVAAIVRFNRQLALETEAKQLDAAVLHAGVRRALTTPELCSYFIADHQGVAVGQTMVT